VKNIDGRIRVLLLLGSGTVGGVETFVFELCRHIDRRRFAISVCIFGLNGPLADALRAIGIPVKVLAVRRWLQRAVLYFSFVRTGRFDIVHVNIGGRMPRYLARLAGSRAIITHVHGPSDEEVEGWRAGSTAFGLRIKETYLRGSHHLIANSYAAGRSLTACCPNLARIVSVIHCGVDVSRYKPKLANLSQVKALRQTIGLSERERVVGFIGRLVPQKGLPHLLAAAAILKKRYSDIRFVIVGDGPLGNELKSTAALLNDNCIIFLGERSDIPELLAVFDILVVPSEWEAFGIVNIEGMAAAKPVVAFDIDGIPEAIVHGETGLLVPHRDSHALASAIAQLLDDAPLRRRMGAAGRRRVEQMFDVRDMTQMFEALYQTAACGAATPIGD
jgi:glycosyltransferase involved in cell wall biosynthesis